jgi:hypothetical protein
MQALRKHGTLGPLIVIFCFAIHIE